MRIIGIDPGQSGGIVLLEDGEPPHVHKMPETDGDVRDLLHELAVGLRTDVFAWLEQVGSMPGQGVSSSFKFGRNFGFLAGVLTGLNIPHELVRPQKWQKAMGCLTGGDKNVSKAAAQRLWPRLKWTHAVADAALIAEYGRRQLITRGKTNA